MPSRHDVLSTVIVMTLLVTQTDGQSVTAPSSARTAILRVDQGHPWRAPFGLERVGAAPVVHVELKAGQPSRCEYDVVAHVDDQETERKSLALTPPSPGFAQSTAPTFFGNVRLASIPKMISLIAKCTHAAQEQVLVQQAVIWPEIEADAEAHPDRQINPVDLGTILPPHDWLLLASGQKAVIDVAAVSRRQDRPNTYLRVWFDGDKWIETAAPLLSNRRLTKELKLSPTSLAEHTILHVALIDGPRTLWKKDIRTMIVPQPPKWPAFGAVETKLRYDAPISVKNRKTGAHSSMSYDTAWDPKLRDVVVFLPNGSRFVFWRGSSYVPFWAGLYNTGLSYEWAETTPPPGYVDCVEPLQDKELRYGRVRILESTASRVHVRWTYESVDVDYKRLGDEAFEDFYFYPDGFGTRVLTLTSSPTADYEITEFITLLPQSAYPFEVLPSRLIEELYLDGQKRSITFPYPAALQAGATPGNLQEKDPRPEARVYRIFSEKRDPASAIYFSPRDIPIVQQVFKPFFDHGEIVTPGYWGNHWPLGRGAPTGGAIDERIGLSPAHLSTFPWGLWSQGNRPVPISAGTSNTLDALGRSRQMLTQRWAWLIAKTDTTDETLLDWAQSYSAPPSLQVSGARLDFPSYSSERRAIRLIAQSPSIQIRLEPQKHTMNPVFELAGALGRLTGVTLDGKPLPSDEYAWDGATLWIKASIGSAGETLSLQFNPHD